MLAAVVLVPMNAAEFAAYAERAVPEHAQEQVESGQWSTEASLELSRRAFDQLLPQGLATPDNFLFTLRDPITQSSVGMLWYAMQVRAGQRIAYLYDISVEPHYRRMGAGTHALEALEVDVAARGMCGVALHVFGHKRAAQALYAKLGYVATNIIMFKKVVSAGT